MNVPKVTRSIAELAICTESSDISDAARHLAVRAFIDTIGVSILGSHDMASTALRQVAAEEEKGGAGSTVLATGRRAAAHTAALLNATAGHADDYDDHLVDTNGHPSVVLVPALLAVGESIDAAGREVLDAYVIGHQVMCAVAAALPVRAHWTAGWHATGTVGILGATAAVARLRGLTTMQTRYALGIAASLAGGSRQNCGYLTKPLHAGMAASNAVLAATLAANGFDADPDQLESELGFFQVYGVDSDLTQIERVLAERWTATTRGLNVKTFPACYAVHPAARAATTLRDEGVTVDEIGTITVTVQPTGLVGPIHHAPVTGMQAKFSLEYTVAAALADGFPTLHTYTDKAVQRDDLQRLLRRVVTTESAVPPVGPADYDRWYATIQITTVDGRQFAARAGMPHGWTSDPLTDDEIESKFLACVAASATSWDGRSLVDSLWRLPEASRIRSTLASPVRTGRGDRPAH